MTNLFNSKPIGGDPGPNEKVPSNPAPTPTPPVDLKPLIEAINELRIAVQELAAELRVAAEDRVTRL